MVRLFQVGAAWTRDFIRWEPPLIEAYDFAHANLQIAGLQTAWPEEIAARDAAESALVDQLIAANSR